MALPEDGAQHGEGFEYYQLRSDSDLSPGIIQIIELYGAQASLACDLDHPVFSYRAYQESETPFQVILFTTTSELPKKIMSIFIFDHVSSASASAGAGAGTDQYQLRFASWSPGKVEKLERSEIEAAIRGVFGDSITIPTQIQQPYYMNRTNILPSRRLTINDILQRESASNELGVTQQSFPVDDLSGMQCVLSHSPASGLKFHVYQATSPLPDAMNHIALEQALYLRREQGYDFSTYSGSSGEGLAFYFILTEDKTRCIGSIVMLLDQENHYREFLQDCNRESSKYHRSKGDRVPATQADQMHFFRAKTDNAQDKYRTAHDAALASNPGISDRMSIFHQQSTPEELKQKRRIDKFTKIRFFTGLSAAVKETSTGEKMPEMRSAWIHPYYRRQGILGQLWSVLTEEHGMFSIDQPSGAMKAFIGQKNSVPFSSKPLVA
jgi:hypothetical protein